MSERKYSVEMPSKLSAEKLAAYGVRHQGLEVHLASDVEALRDKMQDRIDELEIGSAVVKSMYEGARKALKITAESCPKLLVRAETREAELAAEREKTAKLEAHISKLGNRISEMESDNDGLLVQLQKAREEALREAAFEAQLAEAAIPNASETIQTRRCVEAILALIDKKG